MRLIHVTSIKNLEFHYHESFLSETMKDVATYPNHIGDMLRAVGMDKTATTAFLKRFLLNARYIALT